jgi:diguanylate cyclase (GGDEF)-like protein
MTNDFKNLEKEKLADELVIAKQEVVKLAAELVIAKKEKEKRAAELVIAKKEKGKRAAELVIAKKELAFQANEKKKAEVLSTHDYLTGLPNRVLLNDRINQNILQSKRAKTITPLLTLDIDEFKQINDTYGHQAGDTVLKTIAKRLNKLIRATDTIVRYGGDEFIMLTPETKSNHDIKILANRILNSVRNPIVVSKQKIIVKMSIGIAWYPSDGRTVKTLMKNSDKALYVAKAQGGNCCAIKGVKSSI